ncbi:hypothetical protein D9758_015681 [Tetrapyrgos nigripes]|uniref:Cation/H+ exchanger transmembrane domain-containing protein n=1 Tax=Tetrapyrgos nigripes TaxID=182062 RepID=A0A8H5C9W6_9AGAR|nr:hypothetical protein D9758_015681 [Tetrapyrgos nigripes]
MQMRIPFSLLQGRAIYQPFAQGHNGVLNSNTMPELLEVTTPSLAYICLGGFAVLFSMVSLLVKERLFINEVVLGTAFGILVGPYGIDVFDPRSWGHQSNPVTLEVMRIVLAIGLFAIGVEIPRSYMRDHAKGLLVMVVPTMAIGWLVVSGLLYVLFPQIELYGCLAIAACLTPTDPIISAAIVGGKFAVKHVPLNLRLILSAESAANDGLAYPFLSIAIYLMVDPTPKEAVLHWVLIGWLYEVICGTILGAVMGIAFAYLMRFSHRRGFIDRESYVAQYLSLAFLTIGIASTLGLDDLLAAFAAGNALSWDGQFNERTEGDVFSSVIDLVFNCACFIYIGAWLPFKSFVDFDGLGLDVWRLGLLFLGVLMMRRIPSVLLLYRWIDEIEGWKQALFTGHFGPMGVGAIFVSTLAATRLPEPHYPPENQLELVASVLQPIVSFVVLGSIIIHGLSIPFFNLSRNISVSTTVIPNLPHFPEWAWQIHRFGGVRHGADEDRDAGSERVSYHEGVLIDIDDGLEDGMGVVSARPTARPVSLCHRCSQVVESIDTAQAEEVGGQDRSAH